MPTMDTIERLAKSAPISTWAMLVAGAGATLVQIGMVLVVWLGGWHSLEKDQLMYIGVLSIIQAMGPLAVVVSLSRARVAAKGPGNFSFDVSSDQDPTPAQTVTTTTKIEGKA